MAQERKEQREPKEKDKKSQRQTDEKRAESQDAAKSGEWKERVLQIRRVTKVVKGGKKLSFRAVVVVGDGEGQVGVGVAKASEVIGAIQKAIISARKNLIQVPIFKKTIPHPITSKAGAGKIMLKPAAEGTGIIAGGSARSVLELSGIENILCKSLGSDSGLNIARATIKALSELRKFKDVANARGLTIEQMLN